MDRLRHRRRTLGQGHHAGSRSGRSRGDARHRHRRRRGRCGILSFLSPDYRVSPLTPIGFVVATGSRQFILLFFYRLLSGYVIREDGEGYIPPMFSRRRYGRRRETISTTGPKAMKALCWRALAAQCAA